MSPRIKNAACLDRVVWYNSFSCYSTWIPVFPINYRTGCSGIWLQFRDLKFCFVPEAMKVLTQHWPGWGGRAVSLNFFTQNRDFWNILFLNSCSSVNHITRMFGCYHTVVEELHALDMLRYYEGGWMENIFARNSLSCQSKIKPCRKIIYTYLLSWNSK